MKPSESAEQLKRSINHTLKAHSEFVNGPADAIRFHDKATPYAIHPIWCAMTLLTETRLPAELRRTGYQALLWHDLLEDTSMGLPEGTDPAVERLVQEMTFHSFKEEIAELWGRSDQAKLLKIYDKVSNLLDGSWMKPADRQVHLAHLRRLTDFVESHFGELNIVRMARGLLR